MLAAWIVGAGLLWVGESAYVSGGAEAAAVVIDAGHGGIDPGVTGRLTGVRECDLNLSVALELERLFSQSGLRVAMTRRTGEGLYGPDEPNKKSADMRRRGEIIAGSGADMMISVHMNFIGDARCAGTQVFYRDEAGRELAACIQNAVRTLQPGNRRTAHTGDYFVLKAGSMPSVIVECGFLSNAGDEALLTDEAYRRRLAWHIYDGAMEFLARRQKS